MLICFREWFASENTKEHKERAKNQEKKALLISHARCFAPALVHTWTDPFSLLNLPIFSKMSLESKTRSVTSSYIGHV
jgi:hypothetical protein